MNGTLATIISNSSSAIHTKCLTYCTCRHCHSPAFQVVHIFQMPFQDLAQSGKKREHFFTITFKNDS